MDYLDKLYCEFYHYNCCCQVLNKKTLKVFKTFRVYKLLEYYFVGVARNRLTRKITATSATAIINKPGAPRSSAIPVRGKAVDVAMIVCVETAICVNAAATVIVAGSCVGETVAVACAITGVLVGGTVFVTPAVEVRARAVPCKIAVCVNPT